MDMTVFPANAAYVNGAFQILAAVCAQSSCHCGFIQQPVHQKQTSEAALMKHRRLVEDKLMNWNMSLKNEVTLLYTKPDSTRNDGRPMVQSSVVAMHKSYSTSPWYESNAIINNRIDECPLIKVAEMLGFDDVTKPSASARVEQNLDSWLERCCMHCFFQAEERSLGFWKRFSEC
eukprot:Skav210140  [mRNA]  locus=scaffold268:4091:4615:- [translate_table: standard]